MKPIFQAGRRSARGIVVASCLVLPVWVLPLDVQAQNRDPLAEARAVLAQRRDEADQRRSMEDPGAWSRLTNRTASPFPRNQAEPGSAAQTPRGPSPYNPKFGAPTFQMPSNPAQDATAPQLKQFHPTADADAEGKGKRFLAREGREPAEGEAAEDETGRKSTLSYTGEDPAKEKLRTYDEIYQMKSPYALPTFQMPSGPAAALAAPGAQTWGGRVLQQYRPETEVRGLEKARMQREQRVEQREARQEERPSGLGDVFNRTKRLEGQ